MTRKQTRWTHFGEETEAPEVPKAKPSESQGSQKRALLCDLLCAAVSSS